MASRVEIPLLSADASTRDAVRAALEQAQPHASTACVESIPQLAALLVQRPAPLVVIDVDPDPFAILQEVERISSRHRQTRVVLLCRSLDTTLVLQAMQAGARHCVQKSRLASELASVAQRFLDEAHDADRPVGRLVTVLSASGGSGATSIAHNLAAEMGEREERPSLVLDLDLAYGPMAALLGVEARYGLADVLAQQGSIDPELVRSTAIVHSEHLHLLASPASVGLSSPAPAPLDNLEAALGAARRAYGFTVVDAPRVPMGVAATLVQASDLTLLVLQQNVVDVRTASSILEALADRRVPSGKLVPLVNRFHKRGAMLQLDDVRRALGDLEILTVRNDYEAAVRSHNYGQPLAKVAARSVIRKDIGELLARIESAESAPARQS